MRFEVLLGKSNSEAYAITELVGSTEISEGINKAATCSFSMIANEIVPEEGNAIMVSYDGIIYFSGYVFSTSFSQEQTIKVTAYDQLRYLKTSDTKIYENLALEGIVQQLCGDFQLRIGTLEPTGFPLGRLVYDGKQLLDIIANCITLTMRATGELYYIKDDGGYVVLHNIRSSVSNVLIAPKSLLSGYDYSRSIDDDTYNQIKLVRDNKATGKRELYIAKDSNRITGWGLLQFYEKLDDQVNAAQAKEKADTLLALKNRPKQTLSLTVLGEKSIRSGSMICVRIPEVSLDKFLFCTAAKHSFDQTGHTIKIDLRMV